MPKEVRIIRDASSDDTSSSVIKPEKHSDKLPTLRAEAEQQKRMHWESARIEHERMGTEHLDWNKWKETYETHKKNVDELWKRFRIGERVLKIGQERNIPSELKKEYNLFAKNYNRQLKAKANELVPFNDEIEKYTVSLPKGKCRFEELELPEKLNDLKTEAISKTNLYRVGKTALMVLALAAMVDPTRALPINALAKGNGDGFPGELMYSNHPVNLPVNPHENTFPKRMMDPDTLNTDTDHIRHKHKKLTTRTQPITQPTRTETQPITQPTRTETQPITRTEPIIQPTRTEQPTQTGNSINELALETAIPAGLLTTALGIAIARYLMRRRAGRKAGQARVDTAEDAQARNDVEASNDAAARDQIDIEGQIEESQKKLFIEKNTKFLPNAQYYIWKGDLNKGEVEHLMKTDNVVPESRETITGTASQPEKVTLRSGIVGIFKAATSDDPRWGFHGSEIAAYKIDELLGLGMVPLTVERKIDGKTGSFQLWVDRLNLEEDSNPLPNDGRFFDWLIANKDRGHLPGHNFGYLTVNGSDQAVLFDNAGAFGKEPLDRPNSRNVSRFMPKKEVLENARKLDKEKLKDLETIGYLTESQIDGILSRRKELMTAIKDFEELEVIEAD